MKSDIYQVITDRIIRALEAGVVPWRRPWKGSHQAPQNFLTRRAYRGINPLMLHSAGFVSPYWLTFKQVQLLGGRVKKGEHSIPVVFWKLFEEEVNGEKRRVRFLRHYNVFNVAQCEEIGETSSGETPEILQSIARCEQVVSGMPQRPVIEHAGERACYAPARDVVSMPKAELFESPEGYYNTLFHELTHATGHASRLGRKEIIEPATFGSDPYSREELVAEMGAAFLSGHCGIEDRTVENSASYLAEWLQRLQGDKRLAILAATQAQKAADFVLNLHQNEEEKDTLRPLPKEYKVVALRECPTPEAMQMCDTPEGAADYWNMHIKASRYFDPEQECLVVLLLNTRRRVKGHHLVSFGTLDTILAHPREVFRAAIVAAASSIVLIHNHPSGHPEPSEADIRVTRDLVRAGQLLKIEVLDHVIMGTARFASLRSLGYFY